MVRRRPGSTALCPDVRAPRLGGADPSTIRTADGAAAWPKVQPPMSVQVGAGNSGGAPTLPLETEASLGGALDTILSRGSSAGFTAMTSFAPRRAGLFALLGALLIGAPAPVAAQYFGRNKVQYEKFDWRIMRTSHFDQYFYPAESLVVRDAGRMAERWYARHSDSFRHTFDRKSLVFYADHPDFQQTNVIGEELSEGTGGVTEGLRTRVIMPFTGVYADNDHVLGHELVHVFQYSVAEAGPGGLARLGALPLWLIEGMSEYFSLGRDDPLTAMWLRDAAERDKLPTIEQLTNDQRFFPYRYGQALWAYVGGRWSDRTVVDTYKASARFGFEAGIRRVLGISTDSLAKDWAAANKAFYAGQIAGRTHPDSVGKVVVKLKQRSEYN